MTHDHDDAEEFHARMDAETHDIAALLHDDPAVALEHIAQARGLLDTIERIARERMTR